jgi:riboflavin kinase/FMN adenylyltransferase
MGVFVVRVHTEQGGFGGMANVGYRPTVSGQDMRFEVHLFGFVGDLYGQELTVEFIARLRGEMKFESLEALKTQLAQDAEAARRVLGI